MKGDLGTLRKICRYASTVMFAGKIVFACLIIVLLSLGTASLFTEKGTDLLLSFIEITYGLDGSDILLPAYFYTLLFLILGFVTVSTIHAVMSAVRNDPGPFGKENVSCLKFMSRAYLAATIPFAIILCAAHGKMPFTVYVCLGCILAGVSVYCLAIAFDYGAELQKLSDETL